MSNLLSHLRIHHPLKSAEVKRLQKQKSTAEGLSSKTSGTAQPTIAEAFQKGTKYERRGRKWKQLTDSVTFFLAKDMLPIYIVEKEWFRRMMSTLSQVASIFQTLQSLHCMPLPEKRSTLTSRLSSTFPQPQTCGPVAQLSRT